MVVKTILLIRLKTLLGMIRTRLEAVWHKASDLTESLEINRPNLVVRPAARLPSDEIGEAGAILEELDADYAEQLKSLAYNASASGVGIRHPDGTVTPGPIFQHQFATDVSRLLQFIDVLRADVEADLSMSESSGPTAEVNATDGAIEGFGRSTWRRVASQLESLRAAGEPFKTQEQYAELFTCSVSTVNKAIHNTKSLKEWAGRVNCGQSATTNVEEYVLNSVPQQRERDPAGVVEDADVDRAMRYLLEQASPEERARINAMSPAERRTLAETAYNDPEREQLILDAAD